jgi:protein-S-isoprenylcysteine O-methyltransferase Ste14
MLGLYCHRFQFQQLVGHFRVYAVVRHPLYLGWLLMYVAVILFSQHGLTVVLGTLGIVCMSLICRQEDQRLIERFGEAYERYMTSVPALNVLAGTLRLLRRRGGSS